MPSKGQTMDRAPASEVRLLCLSQVGVNKTLLWVGVKKRRDVAVSSPERDMAYFTRRALARQSKV